MFERFAPSARHAVIDAREEAAWAGQDAIHSEHLLIGMLREPGPAADTLTQAGLDLESLRAGLPHGDVNPPGSLDADALATLGIDLDAVRRATDAAFGHGALDRARLRGYRRLPFAGDAKRVMVGVVREALMPGEQRLPFAQDARKAMLGALREAQRHGHRQISSGHLLIGILDAGNTGALTALSQCGADVAELRADVLRRLSAAA
jgi:ATP-dependent Clp protease ATP-binding subunit ClpA